MQSTKTGAQLTPAGLKELEQELQELVEVKLPSIIARVEVARSYGDLSENAEYSNAKEEQELCETRIEELRQVLANAVVVNKTAQHSKVGIGSKVTIKQKGKKQSITYLIVGEFEADPLKLKISSVSPIGKALQGKKKGDEVSVKTPGGAVEYEIEEIA